MEIIKNKKTYFYSIPSIGNFEYLTEKLSDLDLNKVRITSRYTLIFNDKRILSKLKKYFDDVYLYDKNNKEYIYIINYYDINGNKGMTKI
jgi:hypothetical protein